MSMRPLTLAVLLLAGALIGCGDSGSADQVEPAATGTSAAGVHESPAPAGARSYTREDVIEALGVTRGRDENGVWNSDLRTGCFASKIFVSPADNMAAYVQIGDPIATNPSGAVGVTIGTYRGISSFKCLRIFERRLAKLK